jgi:hypothetical protein
VRPFLFHIYDPTWEAALDFSAKEFSMIYVGHTKFRWHGMSQVLRALERVRDRAGRVALVGGGWNQSPDAEVWKEWLDIKQDYQVDLDYIKKLGVEPMPAVPYPEVIATMSKGVFNPVVYRPLFELLGMVTCRTFETPAAGTIPLFLLPTGYVRDLYGEAAAAELVLGGERPQDRIVDVLSRPEHYAAIVRDIREEFRRRHTPEARLRELITIVEE